MKESAAWLRVAELMDIPDSNAFLCHAMPLDWPGALIARMKARIDWHARRYTTPEHRAAWGGNPSVYPGTEGEHRQARVLAALWMACEAEEEGR